MNSVLLVVKVLKMIAYHAQTKEHSMEPFVNVTMEPILMVNVFTIVTTQTV